MVCRDWQSQGDGDRAAGAGLDALVALAHKLRREGRPQLALALAWGDVQDIEREVDCGGLRSSDGRGKEPVAVVGIPVRVGSFVRPGYAFIEQNGWMVGVYNLRTGNWALPPAYRA